MFLRAHTQSSNKASTKTARTTRKKCLVRFYIYIEIACYNELSRVDERDLSHAVLGPTFLHFSTSRPGDLVPKAITGPKSRGTLLCAALWHHVH